jgi:hypothetical protein
MAKLILVSKVFFNELVAEQQREIAQLQQKNELLKLRLFFEGQGSQSAFNSCKEWSNYKVTKCGCRTCSVAGRYNPEDDEGEEQQFANKNTWTCCWQPWFDQLLEQRGFVVTREVWGDEVAPAFSTDIVGHREYIANDGHFGLVGRGDWQFWSFGAKLHSATKRNDAEIEKYENLLKFIEDK